MSDILSESEADKQVIESLLRHIKTLEGRINMSKILFDENGKLYRAKSYVEITKEELENELASAKKKVAELQEVISHSEKPQDSSVAAEPQVETPAVVEPEPIVEAPQAAPEAAAEPDAEPQQPAPAQIDPAIAPAPTPAPIVL